MTASPSALLFLGLTATTGILFLVLGVLTIRSWRTARYLRYWFAVCISGGGYCLGMTAAGLVSSHAHGLVVVRLGMSLGGITLYWLIHFFLAFGSSAGRGRWARVVTATWLVVVLGIFWLSDLGIAGVTDSEFSRYAPRAGPLLPLYGAYVVYAWVLALVLVVRTFRHSHGLRRTQAAYMLAAFGIGAVATSGTLLPSLVGSQTWLAMSPALLLPLFPLTITVAIVRHRLWDIRTVAHKTALWLVLSGALLLPIYLVVRLGTEVLPEMGAAETAVLLVGLFLLAHVYLRAVQPRLDHLFQRRVYDVRKVRDRFAEDMTRLTRPDDVVGRLLQVFGETLYPERVEVLYARGEEGIWHRRVRVGTEVAASVVPEEEGKGVLLAWLATHVRAIERGEIEVDEALREVREEALRYFDEKGCEVCAPLVQRGDILGVIHVGQKTSLKPYTQGDLELIEQVAREASIGLANGILFERVDSQRRILEDLAASLEVRVAERTRELEEAHEKLEKAYEDLKELDQAKNRFFTNISHELRTPLTLILAPLEPMLGGQIGNFDEQQIHHLATIRGNALKLLKLIDDLLDLSRLEDSRLRLRLAPFALAPLMAHLVDRAAGLARKKEIAVRFEARARPTVEADEAKIETVVVNLLSNALKFTEKGAVTLVVDEGELDAIITVSDTGPGIAAADLPQVFDRFFQADESLTRRHGGAGIGLALAKEITELHCGSIAVESELGRGTTFTVRLPKDSGGIPEERIERRLAQRAVPARRRAEDAGIPEWAAELTATEDYRFLGLATATERRLVPRERTGGLEEPRILVVEDNPDMLRYLHQVLAERYEVWPVQEGERAWELLLRDGHDLVVSDIMMPGLSGLDLCARIKGDPRTSEVPVVFLTARGEIDHRIEGHGAGADAYLSKPFSPAELTAVIDRLLKDRVRVANAAARGRRAAVETLLAGMAHELRNAAHQVQNAHIAICEASRDAASDGRPAGDRIAALEGVSRKAVARITATVEALRRYALGIGGEWEDLDLDALVLGGADLLADAARGRGVRLSVSSAAGAVVHGPEEQLRHLVVNLVENAVHAVRSGGREGSVVVTTSVEGALARLVVRDDGPGMPREVLDRAFEPFFSTKGPGEGSGLGLALARRTVLDMGGDIRISSRSGAGTEVVVELPLAAPARSAATDTAGGHP